MTKWRELPEKPPGWPNCRNYRAVLENEDMTNNWQQNIERQIALMTEYLGNGGFFNPELMDHEKVRDMILANRDTMQTLLDVAVAAENGHARFTVNSSLDDALAKLNEVSHDDWQKDAYDESPGFEP